jgi:conjugal transfer pilus assembly protein TraU
MKEIVITNINNTNKKLLISKIPATHFVLVILLGCLFYLLCSSIKAGGLCHGSFINPITDVCWSCLFPMSIGSMEPVSSEVPDTKNPDVPICSCIAPPPLFRRVGITVGYWEPMALVDVTRHPGCMVNLGGIHFPLGSETSAGYAESADDNRNSSFYYVHWYIYPLIYWLSILTDFACLDKADFDVAYLTELDPTWDDDEMAFFINPEVAVFANPIAQTACAADAMKSAVGLPIDTLFWCAGSHGSMYPLDGQVQDHVGGVAASTLLVERMTYKMHRELLLWDSTGDSAGEALCHQHPTPILPKSRYRYQMVNPLPTTGSGGCFPFGRTTAIWGSGKEFPYQGEDFGYLIWRKRNCCML